MQDTCVWYLEHGFRYGIPLRLSDVREKSVIGQDDPGSHLTHVFATGMPIASLAFVLTLILMVNIVLHMSASRSLQHLPWCPCLLLSTDYEK